MPVWASSFLSGYVWLIEFVIALVTYTQRVVSFDAGYVKFGTRGGLTTLATGERGSVGLRRRGGGNRGRGGSGRLAGVVRVGTMGTKI